MVLSVSRGRKATRASGAWSWILETSMPSPPGARRLPPGDRTWCHSPPRLLLDHRRACLCFGIDCLLRSVHLDDDPREAPGEAEGGSVVLGDRQAAVVSAAEPFARRLDHGRHRPGNLARADLTVADVKGSDATVLPGPREPELEAHRPRGDILGRADAVLREPEVVVDVVEAPVLHVQAVAGEPAAVGEEDALGAVGGDL